MTRQISVKNVKIGGGAPISVQTMTKTDTADVAATLKQLASIAEAGGDIARIAVENFEQAERCREYVSSGILPLVADIQFDYRLAIACCEIGFDKIRFNPGNIGSRKNVMELISACKANDVPVRIGVNAGSLDKDLLQKYGATGEALAESVFRQLDVLTANGFDKVALSVKSSDVSTTIDAYRRLNKACDFPLHIGVTESGRGQFALVKSAVGIGALLAEGIGDTLRVSLSDTPEAEIKAGKEILRALGLERAFCNVVSCPRCSRCKYDLVGVAEEISEFVKDLRIPMKIAVMGCVVNGPGEARDADIGVAGGKDKAVIFKKGVVFKTVNESEIISELKAQITQLLSEKESV